MTFGKCGQPSGQVERFVSTPAVDYVRSRIAPRSFCLDAMYIDGSHRSGVEREIVMIKAEKPGGVEYLVIKDTATGPDACQWNLDVLSRQPEQRGPDRVWFPGHRDKGFGMGLEVIVAEPAPAAFVFAPGTVNPLLLDPKERKKLTGAALAYKVTEHWLLHIPAPAGSTFFTVLFPRRADEPSPRIEYFAREETIEITHTAGRDLVFLRPNPAVGTHLDHILFQGRAGVYAVRGNRRQVCPLDVVRMELKPHPQNEYRRL